MSAQFAICIGTYIGSPWLPECLASLPKDVLALVVCEPNYECGKIGFVHRHTDIEEFLFLPDTVRAKTHHWIYAMREHVGSTVAINREPAEMGCFMGKYQRSVINAIGGVPHTPDKRSAVDAEATWLRKYWAAATNKHVLWPDLQHGAQPEKIVMMHGRENAVLENDDIQKFKGTWNGCRIDGTEARDKKLSGRT